MREINIEKVKREEQKAAREKLVSLFGKNVEKLLSHIDYRLFAGKFLFYVPDPGCIHCASTEKLVEALELLLSARNIEVKEKKNEYHRTILAKGDHLRIGIICYKDQGGCQADALVNGEAIECKINCYPWSGGLESRNAVALAIALAYAGFPPEHNVPYWGAECPT